MTTYIERPVRYDNAADVKRRANVCLLQAADRWLWKKPSMIVNQCSDLVVPQELSSAAMNVHSTHSGTYRHQYVFGFHHLHALISPEGEFNCQEIDNYPGRLSILLNTPPPPRYNIPRVSASAKGMAVNFQALIPSAVTRLSGYTFFGSPVEPENWGMWLLNGLLSAFSYVAAGQPGRYLCYAPSAWQMGLLNFMGVHIDKVQQELPWSTYFCEEISLHQYSSIDLVPDLISRSVFDIVVSRSVKAVNTAHHEKIYVSRRSITKKLGGYRALVDEEQLIDALISRGFHVVEPETMSFEDQVATFNHARYVVGPGGAAMFNTVFCKPGTKVVSIESTAAFAINHARLFSALGHDYGFIFGRQNSAEGRYPHNSWTLDVADAVRELDKF